MKIKRREYKKRHNKPNPLKLIRHKIKKLRKERGEVIRQSGHMSQKYRQ